MRNSTSFFKSACIQFSLVLSVLLALGPFLHAHYGASTTTGLHIAGVSSVAVPVESPMAVSFSQYQEPESAALGVETSYARKLALDVEDQAHSVLILTIFVTAGLVQHIAPIVLALDAQRTSHPFFLDGFPPLPHAPPIYSF